MMQFQQLSQQLENYKQFLKEVTGKLADVTNVISSLEKVKVMEGKKEMLVPIASGIFLKAELSSTTESVINVGQNICVNKSIEETIELLKERTKEIAGQREEIKEVVDNVTMSLAELEGELKEDV